MQITRSAPLVGIVVAAGAALLAAGGWQDGTPRPGGQPGGQQRGRAQAADAESIIARWPGTPQKVAKEMIQKYGQPDEATESRLIWHESGPWLYTIVFRDEVEHNFPMPHTDLLEQAVYYKASPEVYDELAKYDGSVMVERTTGIISARCDKEAMNFLALNLAHDVATKKKSVDEAREFYAKTAKAFKEGEQHEYTQRLLFDRASQSAADPDRPFEGN